MGFGFEVEKSCKYFDNSGYGKRGKLWLLWKLPENSKKTPASWVRHVRKLASVMNKMNWCSMGKMKFTG